MTHTVSIRVYWEDTDAGGVVYHASYLRFMERGRTEFLRERGIHQGDLLASDGLVFVVTHMEIRFLAPARIDEELTVETGLTKAGGASVVLAQIVQRGPNTLVKADVTCAVVSQSKSRPARIPPLLRAKLTG